MFFRTAPKGPESSKPSRRLGALFLSSIFPSPIRSSAPPVSRLVGGPPLSVCRNASVDGFRLFQRLRLSKNQSILPGGDRRTAAGRSMVFHVARRISRNLGCRRTVPPGPRKSAFVFLCFVVLAWCKEISSRRISHRVGIPDADER